MTSQNQWPDNDTFLALLAQEAQIQTSPHAEPEQHSSHPTAERVYDYVLGWLKEPEAAQICAHLAHCGQCAHEALRLMQIEEELEQENALWADEPEYAGAKFPGFVSHLRTTLNTLGAQMIQWVSDIWEPQWAGQLVTAADIPAQTRIFISDQGEIELTCDWRGVTTTEPAYIHLAWKADLASPGELWVRFVNPETRTPRGEICLGTRMRGEETLTSAEIGFNPDEERWALAMLCVKVRDRQDIHCPLST